MLAGSPSVVLFLLLRTNLGWYHPNEAWSMASALWQQYEYIITLIDPTIQFKC